MVHSPIVNNTYNQANPFGNQAGVNASSYSHLTENAPPPKEQGITLGKMKRIALYIFSGILAIGAIAFTAAFFAEAIGLAVLIPCVFGTLSLSGVSFFSAKKVVDYDDPKELQEIRKVAIEMTFPEVVDTHGWNNLYRYRILHPQVFYTKFVSHLENLSVMKTLETYEKLLEKNLEASQCNVEGFFVPPLNIQSLVRKFRSETRQMKAVKDPMDPSSETKKCIFDVYDIDKLQFYGIISIQEATFLRLIDQGKKQAETELRIHKKTIEDRYKSENASSVSTIQPIHSQFGYPVTYSSAESRQEKEKEEIEFFSQIYNQKFLELNERYDQFRRNNRFI